MEKVKVILYRKDHSKIGKLELDSDKDVREQLLPMKSRLGIYAYQMDCTLWERIRPNPLDLLIVSIFPPPSKPMFGNPNSIIAIDTGEHLNWE